MIHTFLWSNQFVGLHDLARSPFFSFSLFQTLGIITFNLSTRGGPFDPFHPNYTFHFKISRENAKKVLTEVTKVISGDFRSFILFENFITRPRENNTACKAHHKVHDIKIWNFVRNSLLSYDPSYDMIWPGSTGKNNSPVNPDKNHCQFFNSSVRGKW